MSSQEKQTPQLIAEYQERLARVEKYRQLTGEAREVLEQRGITYGIEYRIGKFFIDRIGGIKKNLRMAILISPDSGTLVNIYGFPKTKNEKEIEDPILVYPVDDRVSRHVALGRGRVAGGPRSDWIHGFVYPAPRQTRFDLPYTDLPSDINLIDRPTIKNILVPWESVYHNPNALEIGNLPPKYLDHLLELLHSVH